MRAFTLTAVAEDVDAAVDDYAPEDDAASENVVATAAIFGKNEDGP